MGKSRLGASALVLALVVSGSLLAFEWAPEARASESEEAAEMSAEMPFQELFEGSLQSKRGVTVYVEGHAIPGIVTHIGAETVEMKNQEYSRIVVRIEEVAAVAAY